MLVSKYGQQIVVALKRFPLPDDADEMDDTARAKHATKLAGSLGNGGGRRLKPEEVARRLRIGKLHHEFKYCRWLGRPSKRVQFLEAHPDCVLSESVMIKSVLINDHEKFIRVFCQYFFHNRCFFFDMGFFSVTSMLKTII